MNEYIEFGLKHPFLSTAFLVLLGMLIYSFFSTRLRGFAGAPPAEAIRLINQDNALVLDVREENEFLSGHIVNAMHIPLSFLQNRINELDTYKAKPVVISCRTGQRSASACAMLKKHGFEKVFNLTGGISAWQNDNLPLVKKK